MKKPPALRRRGRREEIRSGGGWCPRYCLLRADLKVVDTAFDDIAAGGAVGTDHFWVFSAAATNVEYDLQVTDTSCGDVRVYHNPLGRSAPAVTDTTALPGCTSPATPSCVAGEDVVCLGEDGRFAVELAWRDFVGNTGVGRQVHLPEGGLAESGDSGLFFFFDEANWEMLVKVLDGCRYNGHFWVFGAATTDVEYRLRVTDTETGAVKSYVNPLGNDAAALNDIMAFPCGG